MESVEMECFMERSGAHTASNNNRCWRVCGTSLCGAAVSRHQSSGVFLPILPILCDKD